MAQHWIASRAVGAAFRAYSRNALSVHDMLASPTEDTFASNSAVVWGHHLQAKPWEQPAGRNLTSKTTEQIELLDEREAQTAPRNPSRMICMFWAKRGVCNVFLDCGLSCAFDHPSTRVAASAVPATELVTSAPHSPTTAELAGSMLCGKGASSVQQQQPGTNQQAQDISRRLAGADKAVKPIDPGAIFSSEKLHAVAVQLASLTNPLRRPQSLPCSITKVYGGALHASSEWCALLNSADIAAASISI